MELKLFFNSIRDYFNWKKQENEFLKFIQKLNKCEYNNDHKEVLLVIQPWALTPLPWFLVSLGVGFHIFGRKVRLIIDDSKSGNNTWSERYQLRSINRVLKQLPDWISYHKLSDFRGTEEDKVNILDFNRLARKNKTIRYRGEIYPEESVIFEENTKKSLLTTASLVQAVFENLSPAYIILGGGGYSSSGVWMEMAKANNIRAASIDSGQSILLLSTDGIAANLDDIPRAFSMINNEDQDFVISQAKSELKKRMDGKDQFEYQNLPVTGKSYSFGVVLPLNQSYDLSALERHNVFDSQTEWILETIDWVLKNSKENIAIRRHPIERFPIYRSNDDYLKSIVDRFGTNDRVCVVDSAEDINTYDLIRNAKVVVPYISTVGTEAAALGKIVVSEGSSCYSDLGFIWSAKTKYEYFELLGKAISGQLTLTEKQKNAAWKCYYLTQCCNWHRVVFTPQPGDFYNWVSQHPEELLRKIEIADIINAIDKNIPISIMNHNRNKNSV